MGEESEDHVKRRRLRERMVKSRAPFSELRRRWHARKIDEEVWDELEETLLLADVGPTTTAGLLEAVRSRVGKESLADGINEVLAQAICAQLEENSTSRSLVFDEGTTNVWMLVGVNGVGKTTTTAKLAAREQLAGRSVLLAAADTFRAAAAEQLGIWADQLGIEVIRGQDRGDPGAVAFDAVQAAVARNIDLVVVDTAGRLHNKKNLMEELAKVSRVVQRTSAPLSEVLLVLDATTGQNGLAQAREFVARVGVTGVVLTKVDGAAKGGIVLAIESELNVPVKLLGVGEAVEDLVVFDPHDFATALVE